jgi:hypothetical protein
MQGRDEIKSDSRYYGGENTYKCGFLPLTSPLGECRLTRESHTTPISRPEASMKPILDSKYKNGETE